jgi:hypothetical protein
MATSTGPVTIPAGARGFDAIGDPVDPHQAVREGWTFRTFYICQPGATKLAGKITAATQAAKDRIQRHIDAGMGVILNYESSQTRWRGGYQQGLADGKWSADLCRQLGYPPSLAVLASWDEDITAATLPTALQYGAGFDDGLGDRATLGCYGEESIIGALGARCTLGWLVMATFWNKAPVTVGEVVHLRQRRPTPAEVAASMWTRDGAGNWTIDANTALLPFQAWGHPIHLDPVPTPPPSPVPPEDLMQFPPAVIQLGPDRFDTFIVGTDLHCWHAWSTDKGATWSEWQNLDGLFMSGLSVAGTLDHLEVVGQGVDGNLYHAYWPGWEKDEAGNPRWTGWMQLGKDWP